MSHAPSHALGVALSPLRIVVTALSRDARARATAFEVSWDASAADRAAVLTEVLRRATAGDATLREVHVALCGSLADVRIAALPKLSAEELRPAIARDVMQYAPVSDVASVVQVHGDADAAGATRLVSSAPAGLVADLRRAAASASLVLRSVIAGPLAWREAIGESSRGRATAGWYHITCDGITTALHIEDGRLTAIRRAASHRAALLPPGEVLAPSEAAAMQLAAEHAQAADADSLWPEEIYAVRRQRMWRQAAVMAAAALVLLAGAVGVEWRAIARAEATLAAARDSLRPSLDAVLARRDSSATLGQRVRAVEEFERGAPSWLELIASVDATLPPDASLLALRASSDTVLLIGQARRAAPILRAFSESSAFEGARTDAPIDQVVENGEVVAERFSILARPRGRTP